MTARNLSLVAAVLLATSACGSASNPGPGGVLPTGGGSGATGGVSGGSGGVRPQGGSGGGVVEPTTGGSTPADAGPADSGSGDDTAPASDAISMPMPPPTAEVPLPPCKRTVPVANSGELGPALSGAQAGDCVVLADGEYTFPTITAKGTEASPIVVRAANLLKATVSTGGVNLTGAAYVVVEGIHFRSSGAVKMDSCDHCRISRFRMQRQENGGDVDWITVTGTSKYCRIDHNEFGPQNQVGNMIMVAGAGNQIVQYTRIDHNYFHDVNYTSGNGWELIRNGLSGWTFSKAYSTIERNLFVHADSDPETISIKSSENIIRYNTLRNTDGEFTLRHGNGSSVYGNYILGDGRPGSTGLRVYGGNHKIYNNYIAGVEGAAIKIDSGRSDDTSGALVDHKVTYNIQVVFNTIVSDKGIQIGGTDKPLSPKNITVAYNLVKGTGGALFTAVAGADVKAMGNLLDGGSASGVSGGVMMVDTKLTKLGDVFRVGAGSPAIDAGESMFEFLTDDLDGKGRVGKPDIGAQEMTDAAAKYGLLTPADVGPMAP